ncbi:5130_t:CDS:2, partial [Diversispora eburnea]
SKIYDKRVKDKRDLQFCLKPISGKKVFTTNSEYTNDIINENTRVTYKPTVIIYVDNERDVATSIKCAKTLGIGITARSGGHSYESYGTGGKDGVIVVDVTNLNQILIDSNKKTAIIGAGQRLGPIYFALSEKGFLIPAGTCPSVGIAGHALGGVRRKFGLTSDNVISIQIVNANGQLITADNDQNSDLFFALRGAGGGSYGIVTSLTFKLSNVPDKVTSISINYDLSNIQTIFDAIHQYGAKLQKEVTFSLEFSQSGFQLTGVYLGNSQEAKEAMQDIVSATNANPQYNEETFFDSVVRWSYTDPEQVKNPQHHPYSFKAKTFFVNSPGLSQDGIQFIVNFIKTQPCSTLAMFDLYAGSLINSVDLDATAFVHRNSLYGIQVLSTLTGQSDLCLSNLKSFGVEFQKKYTSQFSYQNYIDRDLIDWQHKYYGSNFDKLVEIKKKYDPNNLFSFPQSIPVNSN